MNTATATGGIPTSYVLSDFASNIHMRMQIWQRLRQEHSQSAAALPALEEGERMALLLEIILNDKSNYQHSVAQTDPFLRYCMEIVVSVPRVSALSSQLTTANKTDVEPAQERNVTRRTFSPRSRPQGFKYCILPGRRPAG